MVVLVYNGSKDINKYPFCTYLMLRWCLSILQMKSSQEFPSHISIFPFKKEMDVLMGSFIIWLVYLFCVVYSLSILFFLFFFKESILYWNKAYSLTLFANGLAMPYKSGPFDSLHRNKSNKETKVKNYSQTIGIFFFNLFVTVGCGCRLHGEAFNSKIKPCKSHWVWPFGKPTMWVELLFSFELTWWSLFFWEEHGGVIRLENNEKYSMHGQNKERHR